MSDFYEDLENLNLHPPPNYTSQNFFESLENLNDVEPDEEEEEELIHESRTGDVVLIPDGHGSLSRTGFLVGGFKGKPWVHGEFTLPRHPTGASPPAMEILSCCIGLICLCTSLDKNPVAVWNPLTKEYVCFPRNKGLRANPIGCECSSCSGFGYSPKGKEFKAVRVIANGDGRDLSIRRRSSESGSSRDYDGDEGYRVSGEVYVLGEEKWRKCKGIAPRMSRFMSSGTYFNGKFYWVCSNKDGVFEFLATFDFREEHFGLIPPPQRATKKWASNIRLLDFNGQLSLFDFSSASQISVWILSEPAPPDGGRQWMEGPVVPMRHGNITEPIKVRSPHNDKKMILLMHDSRTLVGYGFTSEKFVIFELKAGICASYRAVVCPRTLVWLKNVVKGSGDHIQVLKITEPFIKEDRFRCWPRFEHVREPSFTIKYGSKFFSGPSG